MKTLNKVQLIGNLTRDPELRYTANGSAVTTFSVATNREWTESDGTKREEATFHKAVSWGKLAEIINQYSHKGTKVFVEGRLSNRDWTSEDGVKHFVTEIVVTDFIILSRKDNQSDAQPEPERANEPVTDSDIPLE